MKDKGFDDGSMQPLLELWTELREQEAAAEAVYATLREAILSKSLSPGHQFVEEDFARLFGVSRTPVREAILRLESERLVDRHGRRGLTVSRISPAEALEIYDVRIVLDAFAAEMAAHNVTPPQIAQLVWVNDRMRTMGENADFEQMAMLNLDFHEWLARSAGNSFLLQQIRVVHDRVRRFDGTTFEYPGRWKQALEEHDEILDALRANDAERARRAAHDHMLMAKKIRLEMIQDLGGDRSGRAPRTEEQT